MMTDRQKIRPPMHERVSEDEPTTRILSLDAASLGSRFTQTTVRVSDAHVEAPVKPRPSAPLHRGLRVADRFLLEELLGRGGMGEVWRAEHLDLGTRVAIKFLTP